MKKKMITLREGIYVLQGEETEGRPFTLVKSTTTKTLGEGKDKQGLAKTNVALLIDGEKSEIDLATLFFPKRAFELSGSNRPKGYSLIEKLDQESGTNGKPPKLSIENIPISFYDKKTGKSVDLIAVKIPVFQMSDEEIPAESLENFINFVKQEHASNLKRKAQEEKERKFGKETDEYLKLKKELEEKGWTEHKNGNFRLFVKNKDAQMFLIRKDGTGFDKIEIEDGKDEDFIFEMGGSLGSARPIENQGIKIEKLPAPEPIEEKPSEKPVETQEKASD